MKRYLIPILFLVFGLLLHSFFSFSNTTIALLLVTSLSIALFLWSLSVVLEEKEGFSTRTTEEVEPSVFEMKPPEKSYALPFSGNGIPLDTERLIRAKWQIFFEEIVRKNAPNVPAGIEEVVYFAKVGDSFHECLCQTKSNLFPSESLSKDLKEEIKDRLSHGLPILDCDVWYLPLHTNGQTFGAVAMETDDAIESFLENYKSLSEILFLQFQKEAIGIQEEFWVLNKSMAMRDGLDAFLSPVQISLVSLEIHSKQSFPLFLDAFVRLEPRWQAKLYYWNDNRFCTFVPTVFLADFCEGLQFFVENAEEQGLNGEVYLGFSQNKTSEMKWENWLQSTFLSLDSGKVAA